MPRRADGDASTVGVARRITGGSDRGRPSRVLRHVVFRAGQITAACITDCLLHSCERHDYNGKSAAYPVIRLVYWAGGFITIRT